MFKTKSVHAHTHTYIYIYNPIRVNGCKLYHAKANCFQKDITIETVETRVYTPLHV